jgi:hypothetical protein
MRVFRFAVLTALAVASVVIVPRQARASTELRLQFSALQRMLAEQSFTQDGRRYVKGTPQSRCSYAYLEHPLVDAAGDGRLRIRARFSGRSAIDVLGHCLGFGDDFDVTITASPQFKDGVVRFERVQVEPAVDGLYARRVSRALAESLPAQFAYPAAQEARRLIEMPSVEGYRRELKRFDVTRVSVAPDALVLSVDFELTISGNERQTVR